MACIGHSTSRLTKIWPVTARTTARPIWRCSGAWLSMSPGLIRTKKSPFVVSSSAPDGTMPISSTSSATCDSPAGRGRVRASIRRQRDLIVDQRIQRRLDVDLGVDDAGLLQGDAGGEDGLALGRADPAVGQFGALLELLVDHGLRQLGGSDE